MLSDSFSKNGDLWWETVISLKSEEIANGYGLETPEDYKTLVDRCIPKFCKMMRLDQKMSFGGQIDMLIRNTPIYTLTG